MAKKAPGRLRKAFFAGVATLLPTVLTIFILTFAWNFLSEKIATPITLQIESRLQTEWAKEHYWKKVWNLPDVLLDDEVLPADSQELQELLVSHPRGDIPFEQRVRSQMGRPLRRARQRLKQPGGRRLLKAEGRRGLAHCGLLCGWWRR